MKERQHNYWLKKLCCQKHESKQLCLLAIHGGLESMILVERFYSALTRRATQTRNKRFFKPLFYNLNACDVYLFRTSALFVHESCKEDHS